MNRIVQILIGAVMGMAEVVPGVSGGTIAFISGIYERLIDAIKAVDGVAIKYLIQGKWKSFFNKIDGQFLITLGLGMVFGLVVGIFLITHLLENYPIPMWAFFFGLILGSAVFIAVKIEQWNWKVIFLLIFGFAFAFLITQKVPVQGVDAYWAYLCAGMIAISALILPGISGSFILLILGMYTLVLHNVKSILTSFEITSFFKILIFGIGIVIGLAIFSRILSWTFKKYKHETYAILTGFIFGSLNKIWPWKIPVLGLDKDGQTVQIVQGGVVDEEIKIISELNTSPFAYTGDNNYFWTATFLAIIGCGLIYFISKIEKR